MNFDRGLITHRKVTKTENAVVGLNDFVPPTADLNGRIELVLGNHDKSKATMLGIGFDEVHENVVVDIDGYSFGSITSRLRQVE